MDQGKAHGNESRVETLDGSNPDFSLLSNADVKISP
jgi:hypothetical protein